MIEAVSQLGILMLLLTGMKTDLSVVRKSRGTALSISSVKIVAMVVREMYFMRRTVGQLIVTSAIIDDTTCWIIMAVTFGLALHGGIDLVSLTQSIAGTALLLFASFTVGRRLVFLLIRWANDRLVGDVPVITTIRS